MKQFWGTSTRHVFGISKFLSLTLLLVFCLSPLLNHTSAQEGGVTLTATMSTDGIPTLVGPDGRTLYTFAHDDEGESTCYDECAVAWPPLIVTDEPTVSEGIPGEVGTVERTDGSLQVTYNGWPLYYFVDDTAPGEAKGQGLKDVWFAANPATVMVYTKPGLGDILVGPGGLTLYIFLEDEIEEDESESYCFEECEVAWPPLILMEGEEVTAGAGLLGELGTIDRPDGSVQVTYNGWPLYFFKRDMKPGDTTGNGVKDVWYVAMNDVEYAEIYSLGVELVAEGFAAPVVVTQPDDESGRLFVADMAGQIWIIEPGGTRMDQPFLDISDQLVEFMEGYDERGLLGLAFHPQYASNGRFFVYYSTPLRPEAPAGWDHTNVVAEFTVSADNPDVADPASQRIIWQLDQPQFNHNAGQIAFGPDGYLYIPIGDGGGGNDNEEGHTPGLGNGQDLTNQHGSILRIDVDSGDPYAIPADNPFAAADDNAADEIYAYGFRNPFSISFDSSGRLFAADAGQELFEEIDLVTAGGNYGWFIKEGLHCFDAANPTQPPASCADTSPNGDALLNPIIEYDHRAGVVVVGGYLYEGAAVPELSGALLFGSYTLTFTPPDGRLFAAVEGEGGAWEMREVSIASNEDGRLGAYLLSMGRDNSGELYLMTSMSLAPAGDTGKVWRITTPGTTMRGVSQPGDDTTTEQDAPPEVQHEPVGAINAGFSNDGRPTLIDPNGFTLYTFAFDDEGESTCYDVCAMMWPPVLATGAEPPAAGTSLPGTLGMLGTVEREDGTFQVTYGGWPLYYYHEDVNPGDANGHGSEDVWFVANPATVMVGLNGGLLVGPGGLTLYIFTEDEVEEDASESYCYDECAVAWPPLVLPPGVEPIPGLGVTGKLGLIERADGEMQVTLDGMPLYFFKGDRRPGDATGHGLKNVWFIAGGSTGTGDAPVATQEPGAAESTPLPPAPTPTLAPTMPATAEPTLEPTVEPTMEPTAATGTTLTISLTGAAEVPGPGDEDGTGTATVNINTDTNQVCVDISVQNITLPATAAHVHVGAAGVAGAPVVTLTPPDASGVSSSCMTVDPALAADLVANAANYYINVHTSDYPDGAVRGQLGG